MIKESYYYYYYLRSKRSVVQKGQRDGDSWEIGRTWGLKNPIPLSPLVLFQKKCRKRTRGVLDYLGSFSGSTSVVVVKPLQKTLNLAWSTVHCFQDTATNVFHMYLPVLHIGHHRCMDQNFSIVHVVRILECWSYCFMTTAERCWDKIVLCTRDYLNRIVNSLHIKLLK